MVFGKRASWTIPDHGNFDLDFIPMVIMAKVFYRSIHGVQLGITLGPQVKLKTGLISNRVDGSSSCDYSHIESRSLVNGQVGIEDFRT
jgi:hypothetical protein